MSVDDGVIQRKEAKLRIKVSLEAAGCHNACRHCYNSQGGPARDFLSVKDVLAVRDTVAALGVPYDFGFPNGHMIHSGWRELWPVMHGPVRCGQINGCRLTEDANYRTTIAEMKELGLERIQLAFYGLDDTHNRFANTQDAFSYDIGAARRFIECGVPLEQVQIVCHRGNLHEIDAIIRFAKTLQGNDVLVGGELMFPSLNGRWINNLAMRIGKEEYKTLSDEARSLPHRQDLMTEADWMRRVHDGSLSPSSWMQEQAVNRGRVVQFYVDRHLMVWDNSDPTLRRKLGRFERDGLAALVEAYGASPDPVWCRLADMDDRQILAKYADDSDAALNTRRDVLALWLMRARARGVDRTTG